MTNEISKWQRNIKVCITGTLWWESISDWWIHFTKGQYFGKLHHIMTSLCLPFVQLPISPTHLVPVQTRCQVWLVPLQFTIITSPLRSTDIKFVECMFGQPAAETQYKPQNGSATTDYWSGHHYSSLSPWTCLWMQRVSFAKQHKFLDDN